MAPPGMVGPSITALKCLRYGNIMFASERYMMIEAYEFLRIVRQAREEPKGRGKAGGRWCVMSYEVAYSVPPLCTYCDVNV